MCFKPLPCPSCTNLVHDVQQVVAKRTPLLDLPLLSMVTFTTKSCLGADFRASLRHFIMICHTVGNTYIWLPRLLCLSLASQTDLYEPMSTRSRLFMGRSSANGFVSFAFTLDSNDTLVLPNVSSVRLGSSFSPLGRSHCRPRGDRVMLRRLLGKLGGMHAAGKSV